MPLPPRVTRQHLIIPKSHVSFRREQDPDAWSAPGGQIKKNQEVMETIVEDIKITLERTQKDKEGGFVQGRGEGRGVIFPINAQGEESVSSLLWNLPVESENRLSQLIEAAVDRAVTRLLERKGGLLTEGQNRLSKMWEIIRRQGDESRAVLDFIKDVSKALREERLDTPRLACLLSPWDFEKPQGLSREEQRRQTWLTKVQDDSGRGNRWFTEEMRLFLVCAKSYRLVPCGPDGHGYPITEVRDWVTRAVEVVRLMVELTLVTLGMEAAVCLTSAVLGAIGETSGIVNDDDFSRLKDLEKSYRRIGRHQNIDPADIVTPLQDKAYESRQDFIRQQEDEAFAEMVKAVRKARRRGGDPPDISRFIFFETVMQRDQEDVGSGDVSWVLRN